MFATAGPTACGEGSQGDCSRRALATGGIKRAPLEDRLHPCAVDDCRSASGASAATAPLTSAGSGDPR
jgi:hypothetical protein